MVGGVIESGCKARLFRRVLYERAHLVVARDEVGEQLRYYARELLGSVAGQGHRSRAQALECSSTRALKRLSPRALEPSESGVGQIVRHSIDTQRS